MSIYEVISLQQREGLKKRGYTITRDLDSGALRYAALREALRPLAELPVGAELFINDECLDTVLYKNGGKAISARDVMNARAALGA